MTQLPSRQPNKVRPRVDFDMSEYRKLVFAKGVDLTWEQCAECPCSQPAASYDVGLIETTSAVTGEARADCELCDGKGYYWHSAQTIRAILTGASTDTNQYAIYGEYAKGMVSLSLLPEHLPAYGDRFTVEASVRVYRETLTRRGSEPVALRYPVQPRQLDLAGGVTSLGVLRLQRAGLNGLSTESDVLIEGVDFDVTSEGLIDFVKGDANGSAPLVGARFSASYFARPRYYVADTPHSHRDSVYLRKSPTEAPLLMPVQAHCSLEFMGYDR